MYSSIDYIELTQYLSGFINATFFLLTNAIIGWGTYPAIRITLPVLIAHNTFDTILGKYWKTDKTLFFHHLLAIFLCGYMYQIDGYKTNTYEIIWWLSLSEINSLLNSIRWFYKGTQIQHHLDLLFAVSFLIIRPLSTYKTFTPMYNSPDYLYLMTCWSIYATLNTYWCICIFFYSRRIKRAFNTLVSNCIHYKIQ